MDKKFYDLLNNQVNAELQAALVYRQLSYDMDALSLPGMKSWFEAQADEEVDHANEFATHILDRGGKVALETIELETLNITSALEAFEAALAHEKKVSALIRDIVRVADEVGDLDSRSLLNAFLSEQIEEEATVSQIVDQLRLVGTDGSGILRIDASLATRETGEA